MSRSNELHIDANNLTERMNRSYTIFSKAHNATRASFIMGQCYFLFRSNVSTTQFTTFAVDTVAVAVVVDCHCMFNRNPVCSNLFTGMHKHVNDIIFRVLS